MSQDLYEILGVSRDATDDELKKAFRKQAMDCHPDRHPNNPDAEECFKELHEAYRTLSDPQERAYYDRTGRVGQQHTGPFDFGGGNPSEIFEELFGQFFGGASRGQRRSNRGNDISINIRVTFEEAAFGTEARIRVPRKETCSDCAGSGAKPGHGSSVCTLCNGSGRVNVQQGFFQFSRPCRRCGGSGRIILHKCNHCGGIGLVFAERDLSVKVPPGIHNSAKLKLSGEGESGRHGGPRGNLYVVVNVDPHQRFTRRDNDLVVETPISFPQAALGAEITVPTLDGEERLRIPAGTQTGRVFRLRGLGMPHLGGSGRGDLHVVVHIDVPRKLKEEQKELLRKLAEIDGDDVEPKSRGIFGKVRDLLG